MDSVVLFVLGLMVGSFLNVCIDRIPRGGSLLYPPSHCEACGRALARRDLVPLLSYLWLRGRCRYCRAPISWRLPAVELATAFLFAGMGQMVGWSLRLVPALFYGSLFLVILVVDLERQIIPNRLVYPALPLAWLFAPLWPLSEASRNTFGSLSASFLGVEAVLALAQSLAGGLAAFLVMLVPWRLYPGGMGAGDVKLAALVGLAAGFPLAFLALLLSFVSGGLVGGALIISRAKGRKESIPFGPFLAAAGMAAFLWGDPLARWYWSSLRF